MNRVNKQPNGWHAHEPVLLQACIEHLLTDPNGIYIDGTLGGGGHTSALLQRLGEKALVFGFDQDPEAHQAAAASIQNDSRFNAIHGNFAHMYTLIDPSYRGRIHGILLDLGVSTHQLRAAERGFSHKLNGPLDMRMGAHTPKSAEWVVNNYEERKLGDIIFQYGEERASRKIAKAIVDARPLKTTEDLRNAIESVAKGRFLHKTLARVFQAIRIEVNGELDALKDVLQQSVDLLTEGGRLCVLSYHSLEDRLVKRFLKSGNLQGKEQKDLYGKVLRAFDPLNNKVIVPTEEEIERNPAARSARLRSGIRTSYRGAS